MKLNYLCDEQHGFVPGRNCITQLLLCLEEWTSMIENEKAFDIMYTDFSKAFDSVAHRRLLLKLESFDIAGEVLNWIKSFLKGRTQCVKVDGKVSEWKSVVSGVPQGSVLGPLLFVIFINDIPSQVKFNTCKLFADDCKIYGEVRCGDVNSLQHDLHKLDTWTKIWQLPFNASKCKVMHLGTRNKRDQYVIYDRVLEETRIQKDLGIIIDDSLKFHVQAAAASKKANQILGLLKKAFKTRDAKTIIALYKSMVRPHLEYGNAIWGPFYQMDISLIESVQRRATKLIPA